MNRSEIEELRARRAQLEEETKSLKKKQKKLEDGVQILEERIIIEQLEKQRKVLRKTVSNLETQKNDLVTKLEPKPAKTKKPPKHTKNKKVVNKPKKKIRSVPKDETGITITASVDQPLQKHKAASRKQPDKKKRFFF